MLALSSDQPEKPVGLEIGNLAKRIETVKDKIGTATFTGRGDAEQVPKLYEDYVDRITGVLQRTLAFAAGHAELELPPIPHVDVPLGDQRRLELAEGQLVVMSTYSSDGEVGTQLGVVQASGLRWRNIGAEKPADGDELQSEKLARELQLVGKTSFTLKEWDSLGIERVYRHTFIKSGVEYFEPKLKWPHVVPLLGDVLGTAHDPQELSYNRFGQTAVPWGNSDGAQRIAPWQQQDGWSQMQAVLADATLFWGVFRKVSALDIVDDANLKSVLEAWTDDAKLLRTGSDFDQRVRAALTARDDEGYNLPKPMKL
eukprot:4106744-Prymnesium_polylepis.1